MYIQIDPHTLERAEERGANEEEIKDVLNSGLPINVNTDLLYIRLDGQRQPVINKRLSEDIALDIGEGDKIVGIEILDASMRLRLERLLPVRYQVAPELAVA